jgi:hypothetical protein
MTLGYYTTCAKEAENLPIIQDAINWLHLRYILAVSMVRSDSEMSRNKTKEWLNRRGIGFERCAPHTHAQNGIAERMGGVIMEKARAMRLSSRLPHALWREIVATAVYLYNRTPRHSLKWKSPYEAFHQYVMTAQGATAPRHATYHHLKAYGSKCYVLIKNPKDKDYPGKSQKLDPCAHIGYLVGYESTNIYRVWIPHKKKVTSARDVIFDEDSLFDGKPMRLTSELMTALDEAVEEVELPPAPNQEDIQLRLDETISDFLPAMPLAEEPEELVKDIHDREDIEDLGREMDIDKVLPEQTMQSIYPIPDPSVNFTFLENTDILLPVRSERVAVPVSSFATQTVTEADLPDLPDIEPAIIYELKR